LSASQVSKPRPLPAQTMASPAAEPASRGPIPLALVAAVVVVLCGGAAAYWFLHNRSSGQLSAAQQQTNTQQAPKQGVTNPPPANYPVPTDFSWTMNLANVACPGTVAAGSIRGKGFRCERSTLQGGELLLRQGRSGPPDLGLSIFLFAHQGEELSGKTIEITPDRAPPLPRIILRWKNEEQKAAKSEIKSGYALKLVFGQAANGKIPGKLYLSLPDDAKSFVAGTFNAEIKKPKPPAQKK
jgi:hypothetical protein